MNMQFGTVINKTRQELVAAIKGLPGRAESATIDEFKAHLVDIRNLCGRDRELLLVLNNFGLDFVHPVREKNAEAGKTLSAVLRGVRRRIRTTRGADYTPYMVAGPVRFSVEPKPAQDTARLMF